MIMKVGALAAVSLAGNILQFLEFAGGIVSASCQIYNSATGIPKDIEDQRMLTDHLEALSVRMQKASDPSDPLLKDLSARCVGVADDLLAAVACPANELRPTKAQGVRKALKIAWGKDKVLGLEKQLMSFRQQLILHLSIELQYSISS